MLQIDHRASRDIDVFIDDRQIFGFFNPEVSDIAFGLPASDAANYVIRQRI